MLSKPSPVMAAYQLHWFLLGRLWVLNSSLDYHCTCFLISFGNIRTLFNGFCLIAWLRKKILFYYFPTISRRFESKHFLTIIFNLQSQKVGDTDIIMSVENQQTETLENQEISANVTVMTTPTTNSVELLRPSIGQSVSQDLLLGRWRLSLDLFGRVFMEDVALEPGSIVSELGGFPVKEAKFRRDMEKLRNNQPRDLTLSKVNMIPF